MKFAFLNGTEYISAKDAYLKGSNLAYTCPECGKPVFLRPSSDTVHFAHYDYNPKCSLSNKNAHTYLYGFDYQTSETKEPQSEIDKLLDGC